MDTISDEYGVDKAATVSAQSEPMIRVRVWLVLQRRLHDHGA